MKDTFLESHKEWNTSF